MERLRFNNDEPEAADMGADLGAPPPPPGAKRRYFEDGGYADVGDAVPGSGLPADQVQIKSTNIKPYMANPDLARQEAEVTKARYGGSSIPPPYQEPKVGVAEAGTPPVHNRSRFEKEIFKEIGGNPFEINVVKQMNDVSARDLPKLFSSVFKGQVVWEDRNKLNKKQADFWQAQVQGYRAHVKEQLESERKTKIEVYNHMMKTFDNDTKEQEAAEKRVKEREKEWADLNKSNKTAQKDDLKRLTELQKNKREIMKEQAEIIEKGTDLTTGALSPAAEIRFMELGEQLKFVKGEAEQLLMQHYPDYAAKKAKDVAGNAGESVKPGAAPAGATASARPGAPAAKPTARQDLPVSALESAAAIGGTVDSQVMPDIPAGAPAPKPSPKPDAEASGATKIKFKPHPKGVPVEVKRNAKGQLIGKFGDGSLAYLEEVI